MRCLHGVRSLLTAWVLLGHTFAFHIMMPIQNRIVHDTVICICYDFHCISVHFLYFGSLIIELWVSICFFLVPKTVSQYDYLFGIILSRLVSGFEWFAGVN